MGVRMEQTVLRSIVLCFFMDGCLIAGAWVEQNPGLQLILALLVVVPLMIAIDLLRASRWYGDDID